MKRAIFPNFSSISFLLFVVLISSAAAQQHDLNYTLNSVFEGNAVIFRVDLKFKSDAQRMTKLVLPSAWDGQEQLYNSIKNLRAISSDIQIADTAEPNIKSIAHNANQTLHIQYDVVQDWAGSEIKDGLFNRAILQKNYFYLIGNSFLVYPESDEEKQIFVRFQWQNIPKTWTLANSFGISKRQQSFKTSIEELRKGIYLGGDFRLKPVPINGKPIYIATRGVWKFADEEFNSLVGKVMRVERSFWNDNNFSYFLVLLFPTDDSNSSGESRTNSFVIYASRNAEKPSAFKYHLAHELFHDWNPKRLGGIESESLYWFSEGFTDYYTSLLLLRAGLITSDDYVADYNSVLKNYYTSPFRNHSDKQILIDRLSNYDAQRQPYQRGNLLAHNWNAQIRAATGGKYSLDDVMRDLFKSASRNGFRLSNTTINQAIRHYLKEGVLEDIRRYVENGSTILPRKDIIGSCLQMKIVDFAPFDAGFDIEATYPKRIFVGVKEGSNAYLAGMRNGQKWIGGGIERDPNVLAEFVVEESGIRKTIKFYPAGDKIAIPQFFQSSGKSNTNLCSSLQ
jgi:predicted metalloprotease with PDZ domain